MGATGTVLRLLKIASAVEDDTALAAVAVVVQELTLRVHAAASDTFVLRAAACVLPSCTQQMIGAADGVALDTEVGAAAVPAVVVVEADGAACAAPSIDRAVAEKVVAPSPARVSHGGNATASAALATASVLLHFVWLPVLLAASFWWT